MPTSLRTPLCRYACLSDLPSIARCWFDAFFDDEVIGDIMHPHRKQFPEDVYWFLLRGIRERFWDWRHQFIVVVMAENGKEKVIGAADWRRIGDGGRARELCTCDPRNFIKPALGLYHTLSLAFFPNRAADPKASSFLSSAVANAEQYWTGDHAECSDLHVCGVDSKFQGRGIGKLLVNLGTSVMTGEKMRGFYARSGLTEEAGQENSEQRRGIVLFRRAKVRDLT
ncbi:uncharacterized protein BDR25DRAFT_332556 [Lindgomyces ingoldianus]|uniref:Uncharacterized protein n=1 Tax=Lindgomyces ingoldianus TaxID=673940 RepID=A0ACB6R3N5_9PLEO|nr:uncharacterized protein BDR25DRAFT_332556 [Lindgomyces ingoldianus]KAF2473756.1 hypothetical protein BDR25DRAFT_332556 [Lindgomyces ingoldianus]